LPTEAEWEYAYRAGTTTEYFWGDDESQREKYAFKWQSFDMPATTSVGTKLPNPWGFYDMVSNVAEW
jgi:formylglycine-generating enzyme required for sulfatase activity